MKRLLILPAMAAVVALSLGACESRDENYAAATTPPVQYQLAPSSDAIVVPTMP